MRARIIEMQFDDKGYQAGGRDDAESWIRLKIDSEQGELIWAEVTKTDADGYPEPGWDAEFLISVKKQKHWWEFWR